MHWRSSAHLSEIIRCHIRSRSQSLVESRTAGAGCRGRWIVVLTLSAVSADRPPQNLKLPVTTVDVHAAADQAEEVAGPYFVLPTRLVLLYAGYPIVSYREAWILPRRTVYVIRFVVCQLACAEPTAGVESPLAAG